MGAKSRKLNAMDRGRKVRPPLVWWRKVYRKVRRTYGPAGRRRLGRIVGGVWAQLPTSAKRRAIRKYQKGR
jgi:hypothetical protein